MLIKLAIAFTLLALTVLIHASGLTLLMKQILLTRNDSRFVPRTWLLIKVAAWVITIHWVEISVWALFYWWQKCLPDFESSLYFSLVTYTTVGYGDIVLSQGWRILAGVEALTGILMCGWTTGFFFTVVSKIYARPPESNNSL